jgi:hypothetical protein
MPDDTTNPEPDETLTQDQAPPDTAASSTDPGSATEPADGSLSQPDTSPQQPNPQQPDPRAALNTTGGQPRQQPQQPVDWQARYREVQSYNDRRFTKMKQDMDQRERELTELRQFRQQSEQQAQQANIRPWSPRHPLHGKFQQVLSKAQMVNQALRQIDPNLPPEAQDAAKRAIVAQMTPEEQGVMQQYQQESQQFQRDFFADPQGAIAPLVEPLIAQAIQQYVSGKQAERDVESHFTDPRMKPVLDQYGDEIAQRLESGSKYDDAMELAWQKAENARMAAELDGLRKRAGMGAAQQQLVRQQNAVTSDPRVSDKPDVYRMAVKEAAKQGIPTDHPRFMKILDQINARLQS